MTAILPVAASLPGPSLSGPGSASSIGGAAMEQASGDASTLQFNIAELMHAAGSHLVSPSAFSGEAIGNALKSYVTRVHRHEEAQKAFGKRAATAVEDSRQIEGSPHRGPAYASLEPARTDTGQGQAGSDKVTLDMLSAAESASLEAMNFMFDTSLVVGTMTEASRSFNTLLKAQ